MPNYTGKVANVISRTVTTKWGPKPVYDIVMQDGAKFSWGFKSPATTGVTDGAEIQFDHIPDKYGNKIVDGTVSVIATGSGTPPTPSFKPVSASTISRGDLGFPVPVTSDKISILRQNALTNARELVAAYPSAFGVDGDGNKMLAKIIDIAGKFADYTSGRDVERKVKKLTDKMEE